MYKVVINRCYGGFGLSEEAIEKLNEIYGEDIVENCGSSLYLKDRIERHDKRLVSVVEALGSKAASDDYAKLRVVEIDSPMYRIKDYDGMESIETPDSLDWVVIGQEY